MDPGVGRVIPGEVRINAWHGKAVAGPLADNWRVWALAPPVPGPTGFLRPEDVPHYEDWSAPDVGWGLVVPDNDDIGGADKARGADLPPPLQSLLAYRHGVVLRYRPENALDYLRRYTADGCGYDVNLAAPGRGTAEYRVPYYLLLYGDPSVIPWGVQFHLNLSFAVGRLHLTSSALDSYVRSLAKPAAADAGRAVIWAADHGSDDITSLLYDAVARPLAESLRDDADLRAGTVLLHGRGGARASCDALATALEAQRPGLVVTTSHGAIPADPADFAAQLGLPMDDDHVPVDPAELLARWQPNGAVWYAHACCSAGSDRGASFAGLLAEESSAAQVFALLTAYDAAIAPLATAVLSAPRPARAFIGHVEPTFDLTVRDIETGQALTDGLVNALYQNLYQPFPVGHCLRAWYAQAGMYLDRHAAAFNGFNHEQAGSDHRALLSRLAAADHRSLVILGDPAVTLAPLPE